MASSNSEKNFLNGKNILVTGASKGIGKYVAKELALLGANIILLAQNEKRLDEIYDDIKAVSYTHLTLPTKRIV